MKTLWRNFLTEIGNSYKSLNIFVKTLRHETFVTLFEALQTDEKKPSIFVACPSIFRKIQVKLH